MTCPAIQSSVVILLSARRLHRIVQHGFIAGASSGSRGPQQWQFLSTGRTGVVPDHLRCDRERMLLAQWPARPRQGWRSSTVTGRSQLHQKAAGVGIIESAIYLTLSLKCLIGDPLPVSWAVAHASLSDSAGVAHLLDSLRKAGQYASLAARVASDA
jgi:hypothetical protein